MKRVVVWLVIVSSLILVLTASSVWANEKPIQKFMPRSKMMPDKGFIEVLWLWEVTKVLNLDEEKLVALLPSLKDLSLLREETAKTKRELILSLKQAIKHSQDNEISEILNKLEMLEKNYISKRDAIEQEIKKVLTLKEWAKFVLLQEEFNKKVRMMLGDVKRIKRKAYKPPFPPKNRKR